MISALLTRYQMLNSRMRNYKQALAIAKKCLDYIEKLQFALEESEQDLLNREKLSQWSGSSSNPKKGSYLNVMLRSHDRTKLQIDELMNAVTSTNFEVHQIIERFELGKTARNRRSLDEITMEVSVAYSRWKQLWQQYRDSMEAEQVSAWFGHEYNTHQDKLVRFQERLCNLDVRITHCKNSGEARHFQNEAETLLADIKVAQNLWSVFTKSCNERLTTASPKYEEIIQAMEKITEDMNSAERRAGNAATSSKMLQKFFALTDECEAWNDELNKVISVIKEKSSSIRTSDEANDLVQLFDTKVLGRMDEQSQRTHKFAPIIVEAEESLADDTPGVDKALPFRNLMQQKQSDILATVNRMRDEVSVLQSLIQRVKLKMHTKTERRNLGVNSPPKNEPAPEFPPAPPAYDMSVLLDENLQKENEPGGSDGPREGRIFERPLVCEDSDTTSLETVTYRESLLDGQSEGSTSSLTSSSPSSLSDVYLVHDNDNVLTARKPSYNNPADDDDDSTYTDFMSSFVQVEDRIRGIRQSHSNSSVSSSASTNSRGMAVPQKPPRSTKNRLSGAWSGSGSDVTKVLKLT
ncbi:uncharacterized protein LOC113474548 [Ciona intestinalis]